MQHTGERPHKCTHCDASFTNSSSLKAHTARHTGIFPFKCQVCSRKFAKSYGLKMHSLSHSNEKPFVCEASSALMFPFVIVFEKFPYQPLFLFLSLLSSLSVISFSCPSSHSCCFLSFFHPHTPIIFLCFVPCTIPVDDEKDVL